MHKMIEMVKALKGIGVQFDEKNLKECLHQYEIKQRARELIDLAKKKELDLSKDIVKASIAAVIINYDDLKDDLEASMFNLMKVSDPIILKTIKKTDEFKQLLYILGEAVDRRSYYSQKHSY